MGKLGFGMMRLPSKLSSAILATRSPSPSYPVCRTWSRCKTTSRPPRRTSASQRRRSLRSDAPWTSVATALRRQKKLCAMRLADALHIRSNPCETAAKRCLYHRAAGTNCGVGIEVFGSVCIVGIDACSHLLSPNQHFPSPGLSLFTRNMSLFDRGAPPPRRRPFRPCSQLRATELCFRRSDTSLFDLMKILFQSDYIACSQC